MGKRVSSGYVEKVHPAEGNLKEEKEERRRRTFSEAMKVPLGPLD